MTASQPRTFSMTSEPKGQAQSDEAMISEARAEAELFRRGDYLHGSAQRMRTAATLDRLADRLAALTADHAEAFAGKVVMSQAAFEELRGAWSEAEIERAARARYEASHDGYGPTATNRWATWDEACRITGWREREIANFRIGLRAILTPSESENDG